MGCNSDYQKATLDEVEAANVMAFLEELESGKLPDYYGNGNDSRVYSKDATEMLKEMVPKLCKKLQKADVTKYSLELQMWWRDHKQADKERVQRELKQKRTRKQKEKALAKLTEYERKLLKLQD